MALPAGPGAPTVPQSLPQVGQQSPPGSAPPGPPGVTQPTANRGNQASGLAWVGTAVRLLERALPLLGAGTEPGQAVMKALSSLSKHVPPGSTSPGVENSALQQAMMQQKAEQPMLQLLRSQGGGGGQPPQPAPGAGSQAA